MTLSDYLSILLNCISIYLDESRQADNTAGSYKVLLPDGRVQTVVYSVNGPDGGYIADIAYDGVAKVSVLKIYLATSDYAPRDL